MGSKRKLRRKIAEQLSEKMAYLNTCPNERCIILNIVLSKKDKFAWERKCEMGCTRINCECHPSHRRREEFEDGKCCFD